MFHFFPPRFWSQITKASFIDGGFFKTGDTVTVDEDSYYIILGRKLYRFHKLFIFFVDLIFPQS